MLSKHPKLFWKLFFDCLMLRKVEYVFKNLQELRENSDLFAYAKTLKFYAGELYFDLYEKAEFLNGIKNALGQGCEITAVFGPALYVESREFLKLACNSPKIHLYKRRFRDPAHFKIVERKNGSKYAVVDRRHPIGAGTYERGSALLFKGYDDVIGRLEEKFERELNNAKKIDVCSNLISEFSNQGRDENTKEYYGFITRVNGGGKVDLATEEQIEKLAEYIFCNCSGKPAC